MKELVLHMYRTLLSKKFRSESQAKEALTARIRNGQTREEAITSMYVSYVDVLLGMKAPHADDQEDVLQLENRQN